MLRKIRKGKEVPKHFNCTTIQTNIHHHSVSVAMVTVQLKFDMHQDAKE